MPKVVTSRLLQGAQLVSVLALVFAATSFASARLRSPMSGIDDANIFFVYARSVSAGDGFVFNPGSERVEGFTSFLWVMVCSGAMAISGAPERYLLTLNILLVSVTIACCLRSFVLRTGTGMSASLPWASAFLILLLLDFRYITWNTITLMETALWTCLVTTTALIVIEGPCSRRHASGLAVLVTLLIMTRPEALVWVPTLCGLLYLRRVASVDRAHTLSAVVPALLAFVLATMLLTLFRLVYFGLPLPNTFYAKVSPSLSFSLNEGASYLGRYLLSGPVTFACGVAILLSIVHLFRVRFRDARTLALTVLALVGLAVPVLTGGDHFDGFRFYQSVYPLLLLALLNFARFIVPAYVSVASDNAIPHNLRLVGAAAMIAVLLTVQLVDWTQFDSRGLQAEFDIAEAGRQQGHRINLLFENVHPLPDIGTISVGGFKYAYDGYVIDLMGLNNTKMAHNGGDRVGLRSHAAFERRTFYELKPTIVMPLVQYSLELRMADQRVSFVDIALKGVLQEKHFRDVYRLAEVRKTTPGGSVALAAWYDRNFLSDLERSGTFVIQFGGEGGHQ